MSRSYLLTCLVEWPFLLSTSCSHTISYQEGSITTQQTRAQWFQISFRDISWMNRRARKHGLNPFLSSLLTFSVQAPYFLLTDYLWCTSTRLMLSSVVWSVVTTIVLKLSVEAVIAAGIVLMIVPKKRTGVIFNDEVWSSAPFTNIEIVVNLGVRRQAVSKYRNLTLL